MKKLITSKNHISQYFPLGLKIRVFPRTIFPGNYHWEFPPLVFPGQPCLTVKNIPTLLSLFNQPSIILMYFKKKICHKKEFWPRSTCIFLNAHMFGWFVSHNNRLFEICFHFAGHRSSTQEFSAGPSEFLPDLHFLCKIVLNTSNLIPLLLF